MSKRVSADPKSNYSRVSVLTKIQLDQNTIDELFSCLNIDETDNGFVDDKYVIVSKVEAALGEYEPAVKIFDEEPRQANILSAITPVREKIGELIWLLNDLNEVVFERLNENGFDRHDGFEALTKFHNAFLKVERKCEGKDGRQGVHKYALKMVIAKIQSIFSSYYKIIDDELDANVKNGKGFIKPSSDEKNSLNEFVKYCLKAANIKFPKDISRYLDLEKFKV